MTPATNEHSPINSNIEGCFDAAEDKYSATPSKGLAIPTAYWNLDDRKYLWPKSKQAFGSIRSIAARAIKTVPNKICIYMVFGAPLWFAGDRFIFCRFCVIQNVHCYVLS